MMPQANLFVAAPLNMGREAELEALLHLATAYQYRGHHDRAQEFFREGLKR